MVMSDKTYTINKLEKVAVTWTRAQWTVLWFILGQQPNTTDVEIKSSGDYWVQYSLKEIR
jgi:hypothetical protein